MNFFENQIEDMLQYKESLGYSRRTYSCFLNDLARYLSQKGISSEKLMISDIMPWCVQRDTEKPEGFRRRMTAVRELTKYLYAIGKCDSILSMDSIPSIHRYTPYLFTDAELQAVFQSSDVQESASRNPLYKDIIAVIYRLIYFCGLRPNEGRELYRKDIDTDRCTLLIRKNKTHKERMIPMAEDLAALCKKYLVRRDILFPDSEYLFPTATGKVYPAKWLTQQFHQIWNHAFPEKKDVRVRVYDLRHRFATAVLMEWIDRGEDLYTALPYLSAYMGHSDYKDTAYYIHLLPERILKSSAVNWEHFQALIPEVAAHD